MATFETNRDFLKFTKVLIRCLTFVCSIMLYISMLAFFRHDYFRITLVLVFTSYLYMFYTIVKYLIKKDSGLSFWFSGFNCLSWLLSDVLWLVLGGFHVSYDKDTFIVVDFKWELCWLLLLVLTTVLSLPLARRMSTRIGSYNMRNTRRGGAFAPLGFLFVVFVPKFMNYIKDNLPTITFDVVLLLMSLGIFMIFQVCSYSFLFYKLKQE